MKNPNQTTDKQKVVASPIDTQALQVIAGALPPPVVTGTSSNTSTEELSPALLGAIQQIVVIALREHVPIAAPPRLTPPPEANVPEEEVEEEAPVPVPPIGRRREIPLPGPQEVPPQWLAHLEHLQKGLQDVKYRIEGAPEDEQQGIPFTETVMADELPLNCRTPAIAEYDGTTDPMEHLSRFENAALLHRYTDGIKCRVFVTTFARAAQQWFNQLPVGAIGSFQEFRSLFLHQFASSRNIGGACCHPRSESQCLLPRAIGWDFFKSLPKKPVSKFDALLARAAKYINMEEAQAVKKGRKGEKRKEIKEEAPSKKSRVDTRDRKSSFQREDPQEEILTRHGSHRGSGTPTRHGLAPSDNGRGTTRKTCLLKFLVVDVPSAYNVILGRPTLNALQADEDDTPDKAPPSKKGKAPEEETSEETKTPAKVQPAEELLNIEIIPGNPDKTTRIGSHLGKEAKKEITLCLRRNGDIFAWTP
ncbi:UNVERIFIED_CONTAM: hypothetical protein Slati_1336900 [Sesamum latifolium]|uniref:Retrotransposon gag domain-containing protein n=1 Tax=Sesamum latifolium TaxID=2727402 RepID=A0AAW2XIF9_9LAMI